MSFPPDAAETPAAWEIAIDLPDRTGVDALADALEPLCDATLNLEQPDGSWHIRGYAAGEPERQPIVSAIEAASRDSQIPLPEVDIRPVPQTDWVAETQRNFTPIEAGPFFVHGSHVVDPPPDGAIPLCIDAGAAFGTGDHHTTRGCLLQIASLDAAGFRPGRILDLGCGTAILAMAAAHLWQRPVVAADNDPDAVRISRENTVANGLGAKIEVHPSEGFSNETLSTIGPYDLVLANILAGPLIDLAPDMARHLASGGRAVLAGLLATQEADVARAYEKAGLRVEDRLLLEDWAILRIASA